MATVTPGDTRHSTPPQSAGERVDGALLARRHTRCALRAQRAACSRL